MSSDRKHVCSVMSFVWFYQSFSMSVIEVIFPKVRAELLRLLFADPAKEFHLRELTRRSKPSLGTIQQSVKRGQ